MIIHDTKQGSEEWFGLRAGIPTASEFDNLVTPLGKIREGEMPKSFLARKVAEAWLGGPLPSAGFFDAEQGQILEQEAIPFLEFEYGWKISRPGFITTDDKRIGCSPDGLIESEGCGVEVKCPRADTHVGYLLSGGIPKDYVCQVQGSLLVTGLHQWKFVSYRRHFPSLVLTVGRDEKLQSALTDALSGFLVSLREAMERLKQLNGDDAPLSHAALV